jgi:hypothetical protein
MKRKNVLIVVALALLVALIAGFAGRGPLRMLRIDSFADLIFGSDDEPPIIVKNGSMHVITQAEWKANGTTWSNETAPNEVNQGQFWVLVLLKDGTRCKETGPTVMIDYSVSSFHAVFTPGPGVNHVTRTQVAPPKPDFDLVDPNVPKDLRHGADGDGNYITAVKVRGQSVCGALTADNLDQIRICSSDSQSCR